MPCSVPPSLRALACGLLLATVPHLARAQGVGIGTAAPDASAALDIVSSSKGLLLPRVAAAAALAAPATGLLVFQTGAPAGFYYNAGTPAVPAWQLLNVVGGPGDNLGNHTATQALNLQGQALTGTGASIGAAVGVGVRADGGLNIGQNTIFNNVLLGFEAGQAITTGGNNLFIGYLSGAANTTGSFNQFTGFQSGYSNTTGRNNVFSGYQAGFANTTGVNNVFMGYNSGSSNTEGSRNVFSGFNSGYYNTTGSNNQFIGTGSGFYNTSGGGNVFVGGQSGGDNTTGSSITALGVNSGPAGGSGALTNATALGANVALTRSNTVVLGSGANVGIGTSTPDRPLTVQAAPGSVELLSLRDNTGAPSWHWNLAGGGLNLAQSGVADNRIYVSAAGNVGLGTAVPSALLDVNGTARLRGLTAAGVVTTDAAGNLGSSPAAAAFGGSFVQNTTSPQAASNFNVSGSGTVGGTLTAASAVVTGALTGSGAGLGTAVGVGVRADGGLNLGQNTIGNNVLLGFEAGQAITTGFQNLFSGYQSGYANTTGYENVFLGNNTGTTNTTGSDNTVLGVNSGPAGGSGALTNATALGANVTLTRSNTVVLGNGAFVGIGTSAPAVPLDVATSSVFTSATYTFYSNTGTGTNTTIATSIRASGAVLASQFNALSDARLKTVVGRSDNATDLALLNKLRITDYTMRDRVQFGQRAFKKVIAQEVEEVFPQAVQQHTGFLPDVYALATAVQALPGDSLVALALPAPGLLCAAAAGQRLKLIGEKGETLATLARPAAAGARTLVLRRAQAVAGGKVFVFGLEHADVRSVDYEALSMLHVSATQELARQVQELKAQNAALQTGSATDHASLLTLQAQMARLLGEAPAASAQARR